MSAEVEGITGEQIAWLTFAREIEEILQRGFKGSIVLRCPGDGTVQDYDLNEKGIKPGERRTHERRTAGPREGEDRRRSG